MCFFLRLGTDKSTVSNQFSTSEIHTMPSKVLALWLAPLPLGPKQDYGVDTMKITDDDAAFILGKGGRTKEKISKVSGLGLRENLQTDSRMVISVSDSLDP